MMRTNAKWVNHFHSPRSYTRKIMNKTLTKIAVTGASTVLGATAALSLSIPAQAATVSGIPGSAKDFNVFVFENMDAKNTDAEGRIAVGGNATLENFGVASQLPDNGAGDTLVVGGNLNYKTSGQVFAGDVVVTGTATLDTPSVNIKNGQLKSGTPINFAEAEQFYKNYSAQLGGLTDDTPTLKVLNFTTSGLADAISQGLKIDFDANSSVLVNVTGQSLDVSGGGIFLNGSQEDTYANRVLFNFVNTTQLNSTGFSWNGSVLAPMADYNEFANGHIDGQLIAKSVTGTGEYHNIGFDGDLPEPESVPEPLTILGSSMALGFGAFFKRQQSKKQKNAKS